MTEIKIVILDLDGSLTDGTYRVSDDDVVTKSFNTKDFHGLSKLQELGVTVYIITSSTDLCIWNQFKRLPKVAKARLFIFDSIINKKSFIEKHILSKNITFDNIAYMGDDENDLECIKLAAITGCPSDAIYEIQQQDISYISDNKGGHGAVRDFVEFLIRHHKENNIILGENNES